MWPSAHWFWMEDDFCLFFLNNKSITNIDSINREWSQAIWVRLLTYCTCGLSKDSFTVVKKQLFRSFLLFIFVCFVSCFHFEIQSSFIPDGPLCQMWISHQFHVFTNTHCLCVRQRLGVTTLCMVHHHKLILRVIKWSQSTQGIGEAGSFVRCPCMVPHIVRFVNPADTLSNHRKACYCLRSACTHSLHHILPYEAWFASPWSALFPGRRRWRGGPWADCWRPDCVRMARLLCHVASHCLLCSQWLGYAWAAWW